MTLLLGLALVLAIIVVGTAVLSRARLQFEERFPPKSDEEFLARCRPGTSAEVALTVRRIVAEHFAIEYERVHPSMTFVGDIGAD